MQTEEESILSANAEFYSAIEAGDIERLGRIFVEGRFEALAVNGQATGFPTVGKAKILQELLNLTQHWPNLHYILSDVQVQVLSREMATLVCYENVLWSRELLEAQVAANKLRVNRATNVFLWQGGAWRLLVHNPALAYVIDAR